MIERYGTCDLLVDFSRGPAKIPEVNDTPLLLRYRVCHVWTLTLPTADLDDP